MPDDTMAHPDASQLAHRRILIVGVGGLGAPAAEALALAGVGRLRLIDPDLVEESNLHRQPPYEASDVGIPKVEAAARRLRARVPTLVVETERGRFGAGDDALLRGVDVVLDGTDSIAAKFRVNDAAVAAGVPLVHAGVLGWRAQLLTVLPGRSACYRCIFEEAPPPGDVPACSEAGVLGPVPSFAGALQAAEAIRLCTGVPPLLAGRLLTVDLLDGRWRTVPVTVNPRCPVERREAS